MKIKLNRITPSYPGLEMDTEYHVARMYDNGGCSIYLKEFDTQEEAQRSEQDFVAIGRVSEVYVKHGDYELTDPLPAFVVVNEMVYEELTDDVARFDFVNNNAFVVATFSDGSSDKMELFEQGRLYGFGSWLHGMYYYSIESRKGYIFYPVVKRWFVIAKHRNGYVFSRMAKMTG